MKIDNDLLKTFFPKIYKDKLYHGQNEHKLLTPGRRPDLIREIEERREIREADPYHGLQD